MWRMMRMTIRMMRCGEDEDEDEDDPEGISMWRMMRCG